LSRTSNQSNLLEIRSNLNTKMDSFSSTASSSVLEGELHPEPIPKSSKLFSTKSQNIIQHQKNAVNEVILEDAVNISRFVRRDSPEKSSKSSRRRMFSISWNKIYLSLKKYIMIYANFISLMDKQSPAINERCTLF